MALTPASFRAAFPVFLDKKDELIQRHIDAADPFFDPVRWEDMLDRGKGYWVAHMIVTEDQENATGTSARAGDVTAKSMASSKYGSVSMARDAVAVRMQIMEPDNSTKFGQRYVKLRRLMGSGALAV